MSMFDPTSLALMGLSNPPVTGPTIQPTPQFQTPQTTAPAPIDPSTAGQNPLASLLGSGNAAPQQAPTMQSVTGYTSLIPPGTQLHQTNIGSTGLPPTISVADANTITQQVGGHDASFDPNNPPSVMTPAQAQQFMNNQTLQSKSALDKIFGVATGSVNAGYTNSNPSDPNLTSTYKQTPTDKQAIVEKTHQAALSMGWDESQLPALDSVIMQESGYNPAAQNPKSTASGLGQFLDSTTQNKDYGISQYNSMKNAPVDAQINATLQYIKSRYGTPANAWAHELSAGWY